MQHSSSPCKCHWKRLSPELVQCVASFCHPNDCAASLRLVDSETAAALCDYKSITLNLTETTSCGGKEVPLAQPSWPGHAFVAHWGRPEPWRSLSLRQRERLLCLAASSGHLPSLDASLAQCGTSLKPAVLVAAAAASRSRECCERLRACGLPLCDDAVTAAAERGHLPLLTWLAGEPFLASWNCDAFSAAAAEGACRGGQLHVLTWLQQRPLLGRCRLDTWCAVAAAKGGHVAVLEYVLRRVPELAPAAVADRQREREAVAAEDAAGSSSGGGVVHHREEEEEEEYLRHGCRAAVLAAIAAGCPVEVLRGHYDRLWRWRRPLPPPPLAAAAAAAADAGPADNAELQHWFLRAAQNHSGRELIGLLEAAATSPTACWPDKLRFLLSPEAFGPELAAQALQCVHILSIAFYTGISRHSDFLARLECLRDAGLPADAGAMAYAARGGHADALAWLWSECGLPVDVSEEFIWSVVTSEYHVADHAHGSGSTNVLGALSLLRERGAVFKTQHALAALGVGWPEACVLWLLEVAADATPKQQSGDSAGSASQQQQQQQAELNEWNSRHALERAACDGCSLRLLRALRARGAPLVDLNGIAMYGSVEALAWAAAELEAEGRLQALLPDSVFLIFSFGSTASLDFLQARGLLPPPGKWLPKSINAEQGPYEYARLKPWLDLRDRQAAAEEDA